MNSENLMKLKLSVTVNIIETTQSLMRTLNNKVEENLYNLLKKTFTIKGKLA